MAIEYNFKYMPLVGKLSGESMVKQTETAINEIAKIVNDNTAQAEIINTLAEQANANSVEALEKATEALDTSSRVYVKETLAVNLNSYCESQLIYINNVFSQNLPVAHKGFLEVKTNDDKTQATQVFADDVNRKFYVRTGAITATTVGDVTTYTASYGTWVDIPNITDLDNYLALAGGTMSGDIEFSASGWKIKGSDIDNDAELSIVGATDNLNGSSLNLYGRNHTKNGSFELNANNGTYTKTLRGGADGTLTWDESNVATEEYVRQHGSMPVGFEYFTMNPSIPQGSLPLFGGEYSRATYADLWAWVQEQTGYLKTEIEWQTLSVSNNGNVPYYSDGDGLTTFRVPSLKCWVKAANGNVTEVGSYLEAGLPNITGSMFSFLTGGANENQGALYQTTESSATTSGNSSGSAYTWRRINLDASRSNSIYGNSSTVQPESIVGMWLVKAYGTVVDTGTIDEQQYIDDRIAAEVTRTDGKFLPLVGGTMTGVIIRNGFVVRNSVDNSYTEYLAGTDETSSYISMYGKSHPISPGRINLQANNGTNNSYLTLDPNGALTWLGKNIERVNASGSNYIRYESGLQICWGTVTVTPSSGGNPFNHSGSATVTFPASFISTPMVFANINENAGYWNAVCQARSTTGATISVGGYNTNQHNAQYFAVGKWK